MSTNPYHPPTDTFVQATMTQKSERNDFILRELGITVGIWLLFGLTTLSFSYQFIPFAIVLGSGIAGALPAAMNRTRKYMIMGPVVTGATIIPVLVLLHILYESTIYNDWEHFPSIIWAPGMIFTGALLGASFGVSFFAVHICGRIFLRSKETAK